MILGYHWRNRCNKNHFQQKIVLRQDKSPPLSAHKADALPQDVVGWCWPYLHSQQFQVECRCSNLWDLAICDGPVLYCCLVWWMAGEAGSREESLWGERGKFRTLDIAGCRTILVFPLVFQAHKQNVSDFLHCLLCLHGVIDKTSPISSRDIKALHDATSGVTLLWSGTADQCCTGGANVVYKLFSAIFQRIATTISQKKLDLNKYNASAWDTLIYDEIWN